MRDSRGTLSSPGYPNNYVSLICKWHIIVRPGRTIRLTFNPVFEIYSGTGQCVTDNLIVSIFKLCFKFILHLIYAHTFVIHLS